MKKRKAQSAIEFMLLVGAALFLILGLMSVFQQNVTRKGIEKRDVIITDLVLQIQNELNIAAGASDGYMREFDIPHSIAGKNFSIGIYDGYIYLNTTDSRHALSLPAQNTTGQLKKGTNLIRKINATIFLN